MKNFVRSTYIVLFVVIWFFISNHAYASSQNIKLIVNNNYVKTDVAPFIYNNRTYVPVRFVGESLGMKVHYRYTQKYGVDDIEVTLENANGSTIMVDGNYILRDGIDFLDMNNDGVPYITKNNRTFVPIRSIATALNMKVGWDGKTKTVSLTSNNDMTKYRLYLTKYNESLRRLEHIDARLFIAYHTDGFYLDLENKIRMDDYLDTIYSDEFEEIFYQKNGFYPTDAMYFYGNNNFCVDYENNTIIGISAD